MRSKEEILCTMLFGQYDISIMCNLCIELFIYILLLPARASEQGNVIGSVSVYIYIYMSSKKNCN